MIAAIPSASADALKWGLLLFVAIAVLSAAVFALRRWLFSKKESKTEPPWSLQHLRDMHARGQITDAEFQQLRDQMLGVEKSRKDGPASRAPGENAH